jgi:hypothetical protein
MPPWWLILLGIVATLGGLAWVFRRTRAAFVFVNLAAIVFGLACFEFYLDFPNFAGARPSPLHGSHAPLPASSRLRIESSVDQFIFDDNLLGYAPKKNSRVKVREYFGNKFVYRAVYTIGADGLRVMPPHKKTNPAGCIVFFGDSFTFGDGLNDDQTYPYLVARQLGKSYAAYNFGFSGYGPHQMLAELQAKRVQSIVDCRPTQFFFLFLSSHVARAVGINPSHRAQPRYRLDGNGRAVRDGTMRDPLRLFANLTIPRWTVDRFRTWQRLFGRTRALSSGDVALTIAVMREAVNLTRKRYPGSAFDVILFDYRNDPAIMSAVERALNAIKVGTYRISHVVPDITVHPDRYLIAMDGHPNARLDALLADYIANAIILRKRAPTAAANVQ